MKALEHLGAFGSSYSNILNHNVVHTTTDKVQGMEYIFGKLNTLVRSSYTNIITSYTQQHAPFWSFWHLVEISLSQVKFSLIFAQVHCMLEEMCIFTPFCSFWHLVEISLSQVKFSVIFAQVYSICEEMCIFTPFCSFWHCSARHTFGLELISWKKVFRLIN